MQTSFTIPDDLQDRLMAVLPAGFTVSRFALNALEEKVTREESRDQRAKMQRLMKDAKAARPVIEEVLRQMGVVK